MGFGRLVSKAWSPVLSGRKQLKTSDVQAVCQRFRGLRSESGKSLVDYGLTLEELANVTAARGGVESVGPLFELLQCESGDGEFADFRLLLVAMAGLTKAKVADQMRFAALLLDEQGTGVLTAEQLALVLHASALLTADSPVPWADAAPRARALLDSIGGSGCTAMPHAAFLDIVSRRPEDILGGSSPKRLAAIGEVVPNGYAGAAPPPPPPLGGGVPAPPAEPSADAPAPPSHAAWAEASPRPAAEASPRPAAEAPRESAPAAPQPSAPAPMWAASAPAPLGAAGAAESKARMARGGPSPASALGSDLRSWEVLAASARGEEPARRSPSAATGATAVLGTDEVPPPADGDHAPDMYDAPAPPSSSDVHGMDGLQLPQPSQPTGAWAPAATDAQAWAQPLQSLPPGEAHGQRSESALGKASDADADSACSARRPEGPAAGLPMYECEFNCGFRGSFDEVSEHELCCMGVAAQTQATRPAGMPGRMMSLRSSERSSVMVIPPAAPPLPEDWSIQEEVAADAGSALAAQAALRRAVLAGEPPPSQPRTLKGSATPPWPKSPQSADGPPRSEGGLPGLPPPPGPFPPPPALELPGGRLPLGSERPGPPPPGLELPGGRPPPGLEPPGPPPRGLELPGGGPPPRLDPPGGRPPPGLELPGLEPPGLPPPPCLPPPPGLLERPSARSQPPEPSLPPPPEMPGLYMLPGLGGAPLQPIFSEDRPPPPSLYFQRRGPGYVVPAQPTLPPPPAPSKRPIVPRLDLAKIAKARGPPPEFPQVDSPGSSEYSVGTPSFPPSPASSDEGGLTAIAAAAPCPPMDDSDAPPEPPTPVVTPRREKAADGAKAGAKAAEGNLVDLEAAASEVSGGAKAFAQEQPGSWAMLLTCRPLTELRRRALGFVACIFLQFTLMLLAVDAFGLSTATLREIDLHQIPVIAEVGRMLAWFCATLALVFMCYWMAAGHHLRRGRRRSDGKHDVEDEDEVSTPLAPTTIGLSPEELCELGEVVAGTMPAGRNYREMLRALKDEYKEAREKLAVEPGSRRKRRLGRSLAETPDTLSGRLLASAPGKCAAPIVGAEPGHRGEGGSHRPYRGHWLGRRPGVAEGDDAGGGLRTAATGADAGHRSLNKVQPTRAARIAAASRASAGSRAEAAALRRAAAGAS